MSTADMETMGMESLSRAFNNLSTEFFSNENKRKFQDYIGLEKLVNEFMSLNLPKGSEILNVAAGPGILSAMLQQRGYGTIDALDIKEDNIKALKSTNLYRNYICRPVDQIYSTGLRDDVYDVVVMVGGFAPDNISPTALDEILRIVKPDGHVLWTMRADYHSKDTDYGLVDENLADIERVNQCKIIKHADHFVDQHSGLEGLFYLVKRIDKEDFHPAMPRDDQLPTIVLDALKDSRTSGDEKVFEPFSDKTSEGDVVMVNEYSGHLKLCQAFFKLRLPRNSEVLDISHHEENPGLVGLELAHNGYVNVDGLDDKLEALNAAREQNIYRNYILGKVGDMRSIPVTDESYDVILMSGSFAPGRLTPAAFPELIRVLRPGGYILWTMQDGLGHQDQEFALFDVKVEDFILERRWELLVGPVFFEKFSNGHAGKFYMLRRCHREVFALGSPRHSPHSSPKLQRRRGSFQPH